MSTIATFREAIMTTLEQAYGFPFVTGPRNEAQEEADLGCVWLEGKSPMPGDGNMEQITYGVRVLRYWLQSQDENEDDRNAVNLENDLELLQTTLSEVLTSSGHHFFNVGALSVNYELQYVEASLTAFQRNLGARGG